MNSGELIETTGNNISNLALFGLSGSGKDTIASHLEYQYDYFTIRIAGTIKQLVMEKYNLTFQELEEQKRINPELRQAHHDIGNITFSDNRLIQILEGRNFELEKYKNDSQAIVIIDGRGLDNELPKILEYPNWFVVLLSREPEEFRNLENYTEQFTIEKALEKIDSLGKHDKVIAIINDKENRVLDSKHDDIAKKCLGYFNISGKSTKANLLQVIDYCYENDLI